MYNGFTGDDHMDKKMKEKIKSCSGNDGCAPDLNDGKAIVNKVRQVKVGDGLLKTPHEVKCECGQEFTMVHFEEKCPACGMVYGVTPCCSEHKDNIKPAGIDY